MKTLYCVDAELFEKLIDWCLELQTDKTWWKSPESQYNHQHARLMNDINDACRISDDYNNLEALTERNQIQSIKLYLTMVGVSLVGLALMVMGVIKLVELCS